MILEGRDAAGKDGTIKRIVQMVIDRVPQIGLLAGKEKMAIEEKLIAHKTYIQQYGEEMPEIRNWQWGEWQ